jgi:hypothetical protein
MATYVPGAETYLPDIKSFTPDYKFLSAVLDVRTDKYNTNWKATNDLYNKIVYADLSRTDTKEQRDQYINQIAPSLEKISGMDLSMMQNVDSAKAVFAPFFEDDLIVTDIMHTSNYRKEMDYANRLMGNADDEMRGRYSVDGVKGLQYHMEDFINASPDKAMKMGLPKFIENANIMEMSQKILGEMKPPLKMKVDHYGINPDKSINTDWIITEQNGNLVTGAALQYIQKALLDDPRIQRHYNNQAFVRGRDFAAEGMAKGMFATKEEGQAAWASETINRINQQNEYYLKKDIKALETAKDVNVRWDNYRTSNGVVPGSDDDKAMKGEMSSYEAMKAALDAKVKIQKIGNAPVKDFEGTLNKAYSLLMHNNISKEMQAAAQAYGARDMEYTMRENEFAKQQKQFQFDMSKIEQQHQNSIELANVKGQIDYDLKVAEGKIVSENPLLNALLGGGASPGDATNSEFPMGADGLPDENVDMNLMAGKQYTELRTAARDMQLDAATSILTFLNPAGEIDNSGKPTQKYTIKVEGQNFTGTIDQIKNKLGTKEGGVYKYKDEITALYDQQSAILNDPKQMAKYPGKAKSDTYKKLYAQIYSDQGINTQVKVLDKTINTLTDIYKRTHDGVVDLIKSDNPNVKALMEQGGMPGIYETKASGFNHELSKKEYIAKVAQMVSQGKIKNINLPWTVDTGTNNSNYMHTYRKGTGQYYSVRDGEGGSETKERTQMVTELDMSAIEAEAGMVYDEIKTKTNSALTGHGDGKYGKFETATFKGLLTGRTGASDMTTSPVYRAVVDPLSPTKEGQMTLAQMVQQKNILDSQGGGYKMVLGNLSDKKDAESIVNNELAAKAYNAYIADMTTWLGNPKRSNDAGIAPRGTVTYSGTLGAAGDGSKGTAGYTLDGFNQWLSTKVKGSAKDDGTGEYGLFSKPEVEQLRNGISMVFDKKQDINPRATRNQYYSKTLSAIEASPEKFVEYDYPGVDGMTPTASYRIVKTGTDQFYATYKFNTYQPNGTYSSSDWESIPINVSAFDAAREIDLQLADMKSMFEQRRLQNLQDYDKNSAVKGRKN